MSIKEKGVILIVVCIVIVVLLISIIIFFSATLSEKRFADTEKIAIQALSLAEAGANQGVSELRKRIRVELNTNIQTETNGGIFQAYIDNPDPGSLGLLRDYAGFDISGSEATVDICTGSPQCDLAPLDMRSQIQGSYTATITITPDDAPSSPQPYTYVFPYKYTIQGRGTVTAVQPALAKIVNLLNGQFTVTVRQDNFARYALFTNNHSTPGGGTVWFTNKTNFTGPIHTNNRFSFYGNPSGTFTDLVTQHLTTARFYNNNSRRHILLDADSNPPWDVPIFQNDFQRGVDEINLPSSVTQTDLKNAATYGLTQQQINTDGVHVPHQGQNGVLTGGIYVKGTTTVNLDKDAGDPDNIAVFKIKQGALPETTITVDYSFNAGQGKTTVSGSVEDDGTYAGIPDGSEHEGPLLYITGETTIKDNSDQDVIIQKLTNLTISSESDVIIQDNVLYQDDPLANPDAENMLGLLVWGGNSDVRIGTSAPNNVVIDGIIMSEEGVFTVDNYNGGSPRGTATLLGGAITQFYGPFGTFSGDQQLTGYGRNFVYDSRALQGMHPPYFPTLSNFISQDDGGLDERLRWQEQGG